MKALGKELEIVLSMELSLDLRPLTLWYFLLLLLYVLNGLTLSRGPKCHVVLKGAL